MRRQCTQWHSYRQCVTVIDTSSQHVFFTSLIMHIFNHGLLTDRKTYFFTFRRLTYETSTSTYTSCFCSNEMESPKHPQHPLKVLPSSNPNLWYLSKNYTVKLSILISKITDAFKIYLKSLACPYIQFVCFSADDILRSNLCVYYSHSDKWPRSLAEHCNSVYRSCEVTRQASLSKPPRSAPFIVCIKTAIESRIK